MACRAIPILATVVSMSGMERPYLPPSRSCARVVVTESLTTLAAASRSVQMDVKEVLGLKLEEAAQVVGVDLHPALGKHNFR